MAPRSCGTNCAVVLYAVVAAVALSSSHAFAPQTQKIRPATSSKRNSKLFSSTAASLPEGVSKTVVTSGSGRPLNFGDVATVKYSCSVPGSAQPFARSNSQKVIVGDGIMIRGWDTALQSMTVGEKATVLITDPERFGYGVEGIPGFVPPNAQLEMEIELLGAEDGADLSTLATSDPLKPRTPDAIAAAYKTRQQQAMIDEATKPEGLEGIIERAKSFYFFGFFEGETGQQAPWYLRPSITFPIAFAVVGLGFYVTYAVGGISERGAQVTDELDEVILSSAAVGQALLTAFMSSSTDVIF